MEPLLLNPELGVVSLTLELIDIPSVSGDELAIADAVENALRQCSWLEVFRFRNNVVAKTSLGRPSRVILAGHLDTVPAADNAKAMTILAGETLPSDNSTIPHDIVFGLGACDMKGGVAVALRAATSISKPIFDVTYLFYECEEIESARNGLTLIAREHPEWLGADVAVLLEPSNSRIEAGCQGTLRARISATGARAHSARSWLGTNAIHALSGALETLNTYQAQEVLIDGLTYREGLNAVGIAGGVAGNVIPDEASIDINYRYAPSKSAQDAQDYIDELFSNYEVSILDNASGALPGLQEPAIQDLLARVGDEVLPKLGWTDVARFSSLGIPAVNLGPADPGLAHSRNEHVTLEQLQKCEEIIFSWLNG